MCHNLINPDLSEEMSLERDTRWIQRDRESFKPCNEYEALYVACTSRNIYTHIFISPSNLPMGIRMFIKAVYGSIPRERTTEAIYTSYAKRYFYTLDIHLIEMKKCYNFREVIVSARQTRRLITLYNESHFGGKSKHILPPATTVCVFIK